MQTKRIIGVAVLVCVAVAFSYRLGYQHGSRSATRTFSALNVPKPELLFVGEFHPYPRNGITVPIWVSGEITPNAVEPDTRGKMLQRPRLSPQDE